MKKIALILFGLSLIVACNKDGETVSPNGLSYKQEMRNFVIGISEYSKGINSEFQIIPQNGLELVSDNGQEDGSAETAYLNAIDGNGQEDLFYGYSRDDKETPEATKTYLTTFLDISKAAGNTILVTDYCSTESKMDDSYAQNELKNYVSFAADKRELNNIPTYPNLIKEENDQNINSLSDTKNFLYLINPENYSSKSDFITAVTATNYDLLIMDLFFNDEEFSAAEINQLKQKENGGSRLLICYMSIGEVEDYRYYWQADWNNNKPDWMDKENSNWPGNFKVKYWDEDWQSIIFGNDNSYLKKIVDAEFDGVYLDIIDAFEYYE